jgi:CheY-like chemotaxis protein
LFLFADIKNNTESTMRKSLGGLAAALLTSVFFSASAESALDGAWLKQRLRTVQSFVVLTDLHLPGMTGFEALDRIRERLPGVAAVVMTADSSAPARYDAISRTWVLRKPLSPGKLRAALQRFRAVGDSPGQAP